MEYFLKKVLHILHLNVNSLLPKKDEINFIAKQLNSMIRISEFKLDLSISDSDLDAVRYDVIRMNGSKRGGRVACYIKKSLSYNHKSSFCPNIQSIFIKFILL